MSNLTEQLQFYLDSGDERTDTFSGETARLYVQNIGHGAFKVFFLKDGVAFTDEGFTQIKEIKGYEVETTKVKIIALQKTEIQIFAVLK